MIRFLLLAALGCSGKPTQVSAIAHAIGTCGDAAVDAAPLDLATPWVRRTIYQPLSGADGVNLRDINGDGLIDVTSGWEQSAKVTVSFHPGLATVGSVASWPTVVIPFTVSAPEDAIFADVDGDGAIDVVSAGDASLKVYVHFAPVDPALLMTPSAWTTITIGAATNVQHWLQLAHADINGDGTKDLVAGGRIGAGASVGYFTTNTPRVASSYTWHPVSPAGTIYSIVPRDVDGDGDLDLVVSDRDEIAGPPLNRTLMGTRWLENPSWTNHTIALINGAQGLTKFMHVDAMRVIDGSSNPIPNLSTIRTTTDWLTWSSTNVPQPTNVGWFNAVRPGDLDGDGLEDLVFAYTHAYGALSGVVWLRNTGTGWERGEISGEAGEKFDNVELYDVDGDGDLDVVTSEQGTAGTTPPADKLGVVWYVNP